MISSFPHPSPDNIGGTSTFLFSPINNVLSFPTPFNNKVLYPITFHASKDWLQGYSSHKSLLFEEKASDNDSGIIFSSILSGFYPKQNENTLHLFKQLCNLYFVLLVKDYNGVSRLVGNPQTPARFSFSASTGTNASDRNGYSFSFDAQSINPCPIYLI